MIDESPDELKFVTQSVKQIVMGEKRKGSSHVYAPPSAEAELHESMKGAWKLLEWLPKRVQRREWPQGKSTLGWYLPRSEPRFIKADSLIHSSVRDRKEKIDAYDPLNVPARLE